MTAPLLTNFQSRSGVIIACRLTAKQGGRVNVKRSPVVVDELGYQSLNRTETHPFFRLVSARYTKGSKIITPNRSVKDLIQIFAGDPGPPLPQGSCLQPRRPSYRLKDFNQAMKGSSAGISHFPLPKTWQKHGAICLVNLFTDRHGIEGSL
jgi:hypothetical protein